MPELSVSRKSISKLFSEMENNKFLIPDYQRPYKWDKDKCGALWEDISDFHDTREGVDEYFLGTIVSFKNNNNVEIIDGQQRITSLFLLLRAFYKKLELMQEDKYVRGLKSLIAPCIWDTDQITKEVVNKKMIHIESLVATDEDRAEFHKILEDGEVNNNADQYSINYKYFFGKCNDYARDFPLQWNDFCLTILNYCIVLPIECKLQDTALTIFSTLNDRGLPLADSDIFKAKIYVTKQNAEEKKEFVKEWKDLNNKCKEAKISLDDAFRHYTHVLRASESTKKKEIGLRKFYSTDQYEKLQAENLLNNLQDIVNFWLYTNSDKKVDEVQYEISVESKKYLHCLSLYPNEFWKYAAVVFLLKNKGNEDGFDKVFCAFLKKLTAFLFFKFIERPTVNAIKDDIYQMCISIQHDSYISEFQQLIDENPLKDKLSEYSSSKISRALILLHAYLNENQKELIPKTFDIEHIFPKRWQNTNYNGWNETDAKIYLDKFGNKIALEKKVNIQAGNGYFGQKIIKYNVSQIKDVEELREQGKSDWTQQDIIDREANFLTRIVSFFKSELGDSN